MKRRDLVVPLVMLDRSGDNPLHVQISQQVSRLIRTGEIQRGARLPSTRMLAKLLGVSRNTALAAYGELAATDLIGGEIGSGMRVKAGARSKGVHAMSVAAVIRAAHFPSKTLSFADSDGNPLYFNS